MEVLHFQRFNPKNSKVTGTRNFRVVGSAISLIIIVIMRMMVMMMMITCVSLATPTDISAKLTAL